MTSAIPHPDDVDRDVGDQPGLRPRSAGRVRRSTGRIERTQIRVDLMPLWNRRPHSRLEVNGEAHYALLVAHIFAALIALVLGPLQFIPAIRAHRQIHRTIGRLYLLAGVLPSALAAVPVALLSGRIITQIGLTTAAVLWLITGTLAYRAARRHDYTQHQNWMMRNYALTFLAVTSRILVPLLLLAQIPFTTISAGSIGDKAPSMIPIGQTLGWIVNLIAAEALIRRRRSRSTRSRRDTRLRV